MKIFNQGRSNLKKMGAFAFCLGFLAVCVLPGRALSTPVIASATASLDWEDATVKIAGKEASLFDFYSLIGADVNSLSSALVEMNGNLTDEGDSNAVEGAFTTTAAKAKLQDATGKATGAGNTDPAGKIKASSHISLNAGPSYADVLSEAAFTGQFTVDHSVTLKLKVPYTITLLAKSGTGGSAYADALVGLYLFDFDSGDSLTSSEFWPNTLTDGSLDLDCGFLTLKWRLKPGVIYEFEASASTLAMASASGEAQEPVPEPATLFLLGSGLAGLAAFRKKSTNRL